MNEYLDERLRHMDRFVCCSLSGSNIDSIVFPRVKHPRLYKFVAVGDKKTKSNYLPAMIVAAKIVAPVFALFVGQDRDRAFDEDLGVRVAAKAVSAARGRADGQDYEVFGNARNRSEPPVNPRTHQKPRAYRKRREHYLSFDGFRCHR